MRLTCARLHTYRLPYARPVKWSDVVEEAATFLLLRLESVTGHVGVGEITVKPTWIGAGLRSLATSLEEFLLPRIVGKAFSQPQDILSVLEQFPENHAAKALIDNALQDLCAAQRGHALWQHWSGRPVVPVSFTVTRQSPELMAQEAERMITQYGFQTLKIKGGQGVQTDVAVLRKLRQALGHGIGLYVDANSYYPMSEAADYVKRMHDAGAVVVEDPCNLWPDAQFRNLQDAVPCPVLVDFGVWSVRDVRLFVEQGAQAFSLKPGRFGLATTAAMLEVIKARKLNTVIGMFGESALGTWSALNLASTLPADALPAEVTWYLAMGEQVVNMEPSIRNGQIVLPDIASIAERVDWERIEKRLLMPSVEVRA